MIRIKDIAAMAGVSTTTVSNVIHGNTKKVSPENIEKIQALLEETGYVPSMGARMLAVKRSNIIGVIAGEYKEPGRRQITDPFLSTILGAMESEIYSSNYYMIFHQAATPEDIRLLVSTWSVDGIITIGVSAGDNLALARSLSTPLVSIDTYYEKERIVNVGLQDEEGGRLMAEYLLKRGFRHLLFLSDNDAGVDHMRWRGVRKAAEAYGLPDPQDRHLILPRDRADRMSFHESHLSQYVEAGALFFASDFYAVEGISWLASKGIRVPENISAAGFDDNFLASALEPGLTTVRQDIEEKGRLAVKSLLKLIDGKTVEKTDIRLPVTLVVRNTVK